MEGQSGKVLNMMKGTNVVVMQGGVVSVLQPKMTIDALVSALRSEIEHDIRTSMSDNRLLMDLAGSIEFLTTNNWKVAMFEKDGHLQVLLGALMKGGMIEKTVYHPATWCIVCLDTSKGSSPARGPYIHVHHKDIPISKHFDYYKLILTGKKEPSNELSTINRLTGTRAMHPHGDENGHICTGSYKLPPKLDLDQIVTWIQTFSDDWLNYNPSSPITSIDDCDRGKILKRLMGLKNPPTDTDMAAITILYWQMASAGGGSRITKVMEKSPALAKVWGDLATKYGVGPLEEVKDIKQITAKVEEVRG